jgi:hypothetical protein
MTAGRIARELWWTNQEFSSLDVVSQWLTILVYYLKDDQ